MNVQEMITQVGRLGLNGDVAVDTELQEDVLSYLNAVLRDLATSLLSETDTKNQRKLDYTVTDGVSTLSPLPYKIFNVVDIANVKRLLPINLVDIEEMDPLVEVTGDPTHYYFLEDTLHTYPINSTEIRVRHTAPLELLTLSTEEADIPIPSQFHEAFVWGALYYIAYDERDFAQQLELQTCASNYMGWRDRVNDFFYYTRAIPKNHEVEDM